MYRKFYAVKTGIKAVTVASVNSYCFGFFLGKPIFQVGEGKYYCIA